MLWTELVMRARVDLGEDDIPDVSVMRASDADEIRDEMIMRACEAFHGHGFADDELGDVDGFGYHYRVDRWTVENNTDVETYVTEHDSLELALKWWCELEHRYTEWCGPDEEDAIISDRPMAGYSVSFAGKHIADCDSRESAEIIIRARMDAERFWPNVWFVDDHGGHQMITLDMPEGEAS